ADTAPTSSTRRNRSSRSGSSSFGARPTTTSAWASHRSLFLTRQWPQPPHQVLHEVRMCFLMLPAPVQLPRPLPPPASPSPPPPPGQAAPPSAPPFRPRHPGPRPPGPSRSLSLQTSSIKAQFLLFALASARERAASSRLARTAFFSASLSAIL